MIDIVADLHLHSKYSRAVSPQMTPPVMAQFGKAKGIDLLATGDWTHPIWYREIRSYLEEAEEGLYKIKNPAVNQEKTRFMLSVEIATIYSQGGKGRRIHNLVFVPSFETAEKTNKELLKRGFNLSSDGRPIIGLSSKNLLQLILEIDERSMLIPAHVWTPWFGIYGQMSGFESLSSAFEDLSDKVYGIETGLSSDPEMNWQVNELQTRSILSFSDAHSPAKMGREATIFRLESLSYDNIRKAIMRPYLVRHPELVRPEFTERVSGSQKNKELDPGSESGMTDSDNLPNKVLYTIEFYPEEGKYHYSGHRNCNVTMTPEEQRESNGICPVCKRKVTDGVMRRVQELSQEDPRGQHIANKQGLVWISDPKKKNPPFVKIVPLLEIIAEALEVPVASPKAKVIFDKLTSDLAPEFDVLLKSEKEAIIKTATQVTTPQNAIRVAEGIEKVRGSHIVIQPGYDGVFGVVKIWQENEDPDKDVEGSEKETVNQIGLDF